MPRLAVLVAIGIAALLVTAVAVIPMAMVGGASMLFAAGVGCPSSGSGATTQPAVTTAARNSIPADYLALFKKTGQQYGVPWVLLAGIGKVESDDGQSNLPGVHSGQNGFGAAGPMQIGIGGASSDTWGGAPVHPASAVVSGVATDANGDGVASVYEPADAIAARPSTCSRTACRRTSAAPSSPTTTSSPTWRRCSTGRASTVAAGTPRATPPR